MKAKLVVLFGLMLAGANAMACYTVYDNSNRVVYRGLDAPVDMSLPLHEALAGRFPAGSSMVFDQGSTCAMLTGVHVADWSNTMLEPAGKRPASASRSGRLMSTGASRPR